MSGRDIGITVLISAAFLTGPPFWFHYVPGLHRDAAVSDSGIIKFHGGCSPFVVQAQNRWLPYGATVRTAPQMTAKAVSNRDPNQAIAVNGWVHGGVSYPKNQPPWNNDVWFHLADGAGWVSFAGVRASTTLPDPSLTADGGPPAPTVPACQGESL